MFLKTWLVSLVYLPHDEPDALELCLVQCSHCSRLAQVTSALGLGLCVDTKLTKQETNFWGIEPSPLSLRHECSLILHLEREINLHIEQLVSAALK